MKKTLWIFGIIFVTCPFAMSLPSSSSEECLGVGEVSVADDMDSEFNGLISSLSEELPSLSEMSDILTNADEDLEEPEYDEAFDTILAGNEPDIPKSLFPTMQVAKAVSVDDFSGPETLELDESEIGVQGNWVKKKEWLKQAKEVEDEIVKACEEISEKRKSFYSGKIEQVDNLVDDFYRESGTKRGDLSALLENVERRVHEQVDKLMDLTKSVSDQSEEIGFQLYEAEEKAARYKDDVEQIKLDVESIADLDGLVMARVEAIDGYIKSAEKERVKAQEGVSRMFSVIDHEKARLKYYEIKGMYERVKAINEYVQKTAARDFESLIKELEAQVNKVSSQLKAMQKDSEEMRNRINNTFQFIKATRSVGVPSETGKASIDKKQPWYLRLLFWE